MAHGHKPHPETDINGDTTEFAAVELEQPERICYEVRSGTGVKFHGGFDAPIEIHVGQTTESPRMFLHEAFDFPQLCEAEGKELWPAWVLIQPDVFDENPERGWAVITEQTNIGRATYPQFKLGRDVSRRNHLALSPPNERDDCFEVTGVSANPTKVIVDSREHPFLNYELYC